jgi:dolichol kinase
MQDLLLIYYPFIVDFLIVILILITVLVDISRFIYSYILIIPPSVFFYFLTGTLFYALVLILAVIVSKYLYSVRFFYYAAALILISVMLFVFKISGSYWMFFDFCLGYGGLVAFLGDKGSLVNIRSNDHSKGKVRQIEMRRDYVQIAGGLLIFTILYFGTFFYLRMYITWAVLFFLMVGNYYSRKSNTRIGSLISYFERPSVPIGLGAIWFGIGILFSLGLVDSGRIFALIIFASTVGDPLATIAGTNIRSPRLFFNHRKSWAGFAAMLLPTCLLGYFLAGFPGLLIGVTGTVAESLSFHTLDDNFSVPATMGIITRIIQAIT